MQPHMQFLYLLVSALSASFSPDAEAPLELEGDGGIDHFAHAAQAADLIHTSDGHAVLVDRLIFQADGHEVALSTHGRLSDLRIVLPDAFVAAHRDDVGEVADWLNGQLRHGGTLIRTLDHWAFEGRLFGAEADSGLPDRGIAISGTLPLEVEVTRSGDGPVPTSRPYELARLPGDSLIVDINLPREHFDVDWSLLVRGLNGKQVG